jgi:ribosome maturation protein SDO1
MNTKNMPTKIVPAKLRVGNKQFEVMVDVEAAVKFRKGLPVNIQNVLAADGVFTNAKTGAKPSVADLTAAFSTTDLYPIAERIVKKGDIEIPQEFRDQEQENKRKKVVDYFVRNAVDARTNRPFTPQIIESAMNQKGINVDNKPIEQQISVITEALKTIIPLKIETKKLIITLPVIYTGKAYGLLNEYKEKEDWLSNGDLRVTINIPVGLQSEFYDKLNSITHGAALSEEVKDNK